MRLAGLARLSLGTAARQPASRSASRKISGALIAPTAKKLCNRLLAVGLPPVTRLTVLLLKLLMLPRPVPVNTNAIISHSGLPESSIIAKPSAATALSVTMALRLPSHSGTRPLTKHATRLPAEWPESSSPACVSERRYAAFMSGRKEPIIMVCMPLKKKARKHAPKTRRVSVESER